MRFEEYRALDATAMAEGMSRGDFTAGELVRAAADRLQEVNPRLNAVVLDLSEEAIAAADSGTLTGRLAGLPFLVKDMDGTLAGYPATFGSRSLATWVPQHDSELFARYRKAGVAFLGKTNCPELGITGVTESELLGPARNPWNTDHTPGGSSGGSSAAVAAGVVPVAHGGDGGGSIRGPAAYTGLFGLKPSRGRIPLGPDISEGWNGLVVPHVLTRSVRDSALFLELTHGPDRGAPYGEPPGRTRFVAAVETDPKPLRIGFTRKALFSEVMTPECLAGVDDAVSLLEGLGHQVEEVDLDFDRDELTLAYLTIVATNVSAFVAGTERLTGVPPRPDLFERPTWFLSQLGEILTGRETQQTLATVGRTTRSVAEQLSRYDVYVTATTAYPPAEIGELELTVAQKTMLSALRRAKSVSGPITDPVFRQALDQLAADALSRTPNAMLFNMTGQPAMSVPLWWTSKGLPTGVQFVAPYGAESLLFSLAGQLERARPWFDRTPPL